MYIQNVITPLLLLLSVLSVVGARGINIDCLPFAVDCQEIVKGQATKGVIQGWQGIVPLISTRADVERLVGLPRSSIGEIYTYRTPDARIDVSYSSEPCSDAHPLGLSSDIVLKVTVSPQKTVLVSKLSLDRNKYVRVQHDHPEDLLEYINSTEGITIEARLSNAQEEVVSFIYRPTSQIRESRCASIPMLSGTSCFSIDSPL